MQLVTKSFVSQCLAFPDKVTAAIAKIETVEEAKGLLNQASTMQHYASQLKAGIQVERPIAIGVLDIKTKIGELSPAGKGGRGKKDGKATADFSTTTLSAFRKLAANKDKRSEYLKSEAEVPSLSGFLAYLKNGPHVSKNGHDNNEWYTPPKYIELAREVMGGIDLDPCSSEVAQANVKAKTYYTIEDDGLQYEWSGRVWMNPPYGKELIQKFITELLNECRSGHIDQACVLVNNATDTTWGQQLIASASAVCFIRGRIKFLDATGKEANTPVQGQMVAYFGSEARKFIVEWSAVGTVMVTQ